MYKQLLREVGVKVVSVTKPVEEGTPAAVILEGMNEVIAEWYSMDLSVKVSDAKHRRVERGLWNGPVPFGYSVREDRLFVIVLGEAGVVSDSYEKYATGRYTNKTEMLTNQFYLGYVKYKGQLLPGKHPAIIDQELFDAVQAVRRRHRRAPTTFTTTKRAHLLSGLLRSVSCGQKLSAHHISGHDYYQDTCARRRIPCTQTKSHVRGDRFEEQLSSIVSNLKLPTSWRDL